MNKELYSSSELLFSNRSFWFLQQDTGWCEYNNFRDIIGNSSLKVYRSSTWSIDSDDNVLKKFLLNDFWKYFSKRIWQKDDFSFKGIAAAYFYAKSNRYIVKFNPLKFYEFIVLSSLKDSHSENKVKELSEKIFEHIEQNKPLPSELGNCNIDFSILKMLYGCHKNKSWDEESWKVWNNFIARNSSLCRNLISVFIHEYLHIILNHISGREENRNMIVWNYATDFAINQSCIFDESTKKGLITNSNREFYEEFEAAAVTYQYKNDEAFQNIIDEKYKISETNPFSSLKSIVPSLKKEKRFDGSFILNNIMGRSADEYYQILLEKPKDKENNKNGEKGKEDTSGYDNHESWSIDFGDIDPEDDESDGEGGSGEEDSAEGEGKDPSQGNSKGEKDSEEDESENESDAQSKPTNEAIGKRGKKYSGVNKHQGFNDIISKNEIKSALKEILNSMGVDVNDPEEVRKGLESVPGLQKHGATISSIFKVKTKNWKQMLQNFLTYSANVMEKDYTMSRESRIRPDLFPGKKFENGLECVIITDTSGSVSTVDWNDFCNQIKRIAKDFNAKHMRVLQCHTRVTFDRKVDISKINKMEIMETGGTIMQVAFEKLKREKNRFPVILFTDGEIDRFNASDYPFKTLVFVSRGHSYTKPIIENCGFKVICQDEE